MFRLNSAVWAYLVVAAAICFLYTVVLPACYSQAEVDRVFPQLAVLLWAGLATGFYVAVTRVIYLVRDEEFSLFE